MESMRKTTTFLARVCLGLGIAAAFAADAAAQKAAPTEDPVGPVKPVVVVNKPDAPVPVTGTIGVATSESNPLIVREVAHTVRQPFQKLTFIPTSQAFDVPADKRLVIEFVSMNLASDTTCRVTSLSLRTSSGGASVAFFFAPTHVPGPDRNSATFGQVAHLYADPGSDVEFQVLVQTTGPCNLNGSVTVSGYLEDVP